MNEENALGLINHARYTPNPTNSHDYAEAKGYIECLEKAKELEDALKLCLGEDQCICEGGYAHETKTKIIHKNYCQSVRKALAKWEKEK